MCCVMSKLSEWTRYRIIMMFLALLAVVVGAIALIPGDTRASLFSGQQSSAQNSSIVDTAKADRYYAEGQAAYEAQDYDSAITAFTFTIEANPNHVYAYVYRGLAYHNKGDYDQAIADYTQAIRLDPDEVLAYNNRGIAYDYKHDYDRAIADYTQAIQLEPDLASAYYNRGNVYYDTGNYDRAIADYEAVLKIKPDLALAKGNLELARKKLQEK